MNRGYAALLLVVSTIAAVGVLVVIGFVIVWVGRQADPTPDVPFDRERWKACDVRTSDDRFRMLPSLVREHRMIGMTPETVVELLGEESIRDDESDRTCYHYGLGKSGDEWNSWRYPILTVEFKGGRVTRVYQLAGFGAVADHAPRQQ